MVVRPLALFFFLAGKASCSEASTFDANAWQSTEGRMGSMAWPEEEYIGDPSAPDVIGLTLSGGGDRAFTASIGYLSAFHSLNLMNNITYLVGVSGGAWATAVYSYFQHDDVSDATMLGPILYPEDMTYDKLGDIEAGCVRAYVNSTSQLGGPTYEDYADFIQLIYLDPSGVERGDPFSYNSESLQDLRSRNPSLNDVNFVLLRGQTPTVLIDKRPYPIISTTLIGPYDMMPYLPVNRNYSLLEFTPLSTGSAYSSTVRYTTTGGLNGSESIFRVVGGLVESFAFGGDEAPDSGLDEGVNSGSISVPQFYPLAADLALAIGSSSWAVGASIAASDDPLVQQLSGTVNYWAPSAGQQTEEYFEDYVIADGAGVSNTNIISLLQRGVSKIFAFVSTSVPMKNSTHWDPANDPLSKDSIDFTVPAWFGEIAIDLNTIDKASYDLNSSQVFDSEEWVPFAIDLQAAQAEGSGIVISRRHVTVENRKYGIEAGRVVNIVWFYLGRCLEWESQLSEEMQALVVPEVDPTNQASLRKRGPFADFPHYSTAIASFENEQANLLADLTGWVVLQHKEVYQAFVNDSHTSATTTSSSDDSDTPFAETATGVMVILFSIVAFAAVIIGAVVIYRRRIRSGDGITVRKDVSLASQDTFVSGRESEMMSSFTRLP